MGWRSETVFTAEYTRPSTVEKDIMLVTVNHGRVSYGMTNQVTSCVNSKDV